MRVFHSWNEKSVLRILCLFQSDGRPLCRDLCSPKLRQISYRGAKVLGNASVSEHCGMPEVGPSDAMGRFSIIGRAIHCSLDIIFDAVSELTTIAGYVDSYLLWLSLLYDSPVDGVDSWWILEAERLHRQWRVSQLVGLRNFYLVALVALVRLKHFSHILQNFFEIHWASRWTSRVK